MGCIAASQVGSALGAPTEHMSHEKIKETYGRLDRLVEYESWGRIVPPGTTEDGVERQKLLVLSIIDNDGPITARDLAKTWLEYVKEESFGTLAGQQDEIHYRLIKAGISPEDSGYHDYHIGRMGFNRACHPIGIVNACHPELAAKNALDVARLYQPPTGRGIAWKTSNHINPAYSIGIDWAAAIAAAIAEAFRPDATRDSIVEAGTRYIVEPARDEILRAVELAGRCRDEEELRNEMYRVYHASGMPFAMSRAYEVTSKGFALFWFFDGDVKETMIAAANFGRDTDCLASVSAGIAGAFSGSADIPKDWIAEVNAATVVNELTVTKLTIAEQAMGLYRALLANHRRLASGVRALETLAAEGVRA